MWKTQPIKPPMEKMYKEIIMIKKDVYLSIDIDYLFMNNMTYKKLLHGMEFLTKLLNHINKYK